MLRRGGAILLGALVVLGAGCSLRKKTDAVEAGAVAEPVASTAAAPAAATEPAAANAKDVARFQDETKLPSVPAKVEQPVVAFRSPPNGERIAMLVKNTQVTKLAQRGAFFLVAFANPGKPGEQLIGWVGDFAFRPASLAVAPAPDAGRVADAGGGSAVAVTSFKAGDKVEVEWHGTWYKAQVLAVVGKDQWKIHYDGYESSWDEVVGPSRIKPR